MNNLTVGDFVQIDAPYSDFHNCKGMLSWYDLDDGTWRVDVRNQENPTDGLGYMYIHANPRCLLKIN